MVSPEGFTGRGVIKQYHPCQLAQLKPRLCREVEKFRIAYCGPLRGWHGLGSLLSDIFAGRPHTLGFGNRTSMCHSNSTDHRKGSSGKHYRGLENQAVILLAVRFKVCSRLRPRSEHLNQTVSGRTVFQILLLAGTLRLFKQSAFV